ncbi:MAG: HAD hydrolase-like protein [Muribaculaceae bacterium]|nr:HAD hydrolase-like protein [Muribaculaceae bacterium]
MSKIDYNLNIIKAVVFDVDGVLSPSTIPLGSDGMPCRMVNIKDGYAIQLAAKHNIKIAIITGADSEAIVKRFSALGVKNVYTKVSHKLPLLEEWIKANGLTAEEVAYVGDDVPDFQCMMHVGLPVAPADAAVDIKQIARYISPVDGGQGVARDILEELMRAQGLWMTNAKAFGW